VSLDAVLNLPINIVAIVEDSCFFQFFLYGEKMECFILENKGICKKVMQVLPSTSKINP